ncbi:MAG: endopeptidase La [Clostridiales bacterium]|nr:endopeptidase La [Clostridiales bacterium]
MPKRKKLETVLPVIPLRGLMVFPHMVLHFDVGRERSVAALEACMLQDQTIFLVAQRDIDTDDPGMDDLYTMGTIAKIKQVLNMPGETLRVLAEGIERAKMLDLVRGDTFSFANIAVLPGEDQTSDEIVVLSRMVKQSFEDFIHKSGRLSPETTMNILEISLPDKLADVMGANLLTELEDRQKLLEQETVGKRLEMLYNVLNKESQLAEIEAKIQGKLRESLDKGQKDYYLREQIRVIQEELGDTDSAEQDELKKKAEQLPLNDEAKQKIDKELERLSRMAPGSPDITVSRNWIDWVLDLPWGKYTEDDLDLTRARKVLNEDHYAMERVKERIIEYIAVLNMKKRTTGNDAMKGPILCFVGPPGVGKTSIVKSIAKATGRKFVQMSLGGVRDEAEIRGHRRTYVGAIPGRIISGMKQAGTMNPLFLFDEIDKMSSDFKGDPASAMLEVLDGEQNFAFRDHYLDIPFDLSRVMFVTTANSMETIPAPLLDRMEIIEVPSYTEEEKLHIAQLHLLKKQTAEHGLPARSVRLSDAVMKTLIENYTREAGVRTLSRTIAKVVRKASVDMLEKGQKTVTVSRKLLESYLGAPKYIREDTEKQPMTGIVNGLAFTTVGGEILQIECTVMPGTGQLQLTGQLGDVMKESARTAYSWARAHHAEYGIPEDFYKNSDVHIHVPEGAVPKDGPSAGVTMTCAIVSALSGRKVRQDFAMTGEVTLRGRVLPIGALKEKLLAAYRAGIREILIPLENKKDLEDIPAHVLSCFRIHTVTDVKENLDAVLLPAEN